MTDIVKSLKQIDLASITIMGASINFFFSVVLAIVFLLIFIINNSFIPFMLILMFAMVFGVLIFSIPDFFGRAYLFNFLVPKLKEINLEISEEKITNISVFPSALMCSIISMIITAILYPGILTFMSILTILLQPLLLGAPLLVYIVKFFADPLLIVYSFFFSFISVAIAVAVFNLISPKIGGLKLNLSQEGVMTKINSLNVINLALILAIILAILGLIFAIIISIIAQSILISTILYFSLGGFVVGFIIGALMAVFYNYLAPRLGELKIRLE